MGFDDLLVVHVGAGFHSPKLNSSYKKLIKSALQCDLIQDVASIVERDPLTNTGFGCNVDRNGHGSLDASYIRVRHEKVTEAIALLQMSNDNPTETVLEAVNWLDQEYAKDSISSLLGLLRPLMMEYRDLQKFRGMEIEDEADLVRPSTRKAYKRIAALFGLQAQESDVKADQPNNTRTKRKNQTTNSNLSIGKRKKMSDLEAATLEAESATDECNVQDTVGIMHFHSEGYELASSSGGTFFRIPGRVSCAGVLGAGIAFSCVNHIKVSTMCTGNGDDITRMNLASYLSDAFTTHLDTLSEDTPDFGKILIEMVLRKSKQYELSGVDHNNEPSIYLGVIMVIETREYKRLVYCHSTESFYFGFKLKGGTEIVLSRKDNNSNKFLYGEYIL